MIYPLYYRLYAKLTSILLPLSTLILASGCFNITQYVDGNLNNYFEKPIPKIDAPLAATMNLEIVKYQTASNMKATMISDLTAREIYVLSKDVGKEVEKLLQLDEPFSEEATLAALNTIAIGRADARSIHGGKKGLHTTIPTTDISSSSSQYIRYNNQLAQEAYRNGDYLKGDIHNSAVSNRMAIDASFSQAQASANLAFGILGTLASVGEALIKSEFNKIHYWLYNTSGAISPEAPKDRNLSVFLFQFFDAQKFKLDSRNRVAVLLVLTDENGVIDMVLEGSDILTCQKKCDQFTIKPTAKKIDRSTWSEDVKKNLNTKEGLDQMKSGGFDMISGIYHYLLIQQGLKKLQHSLEERNSR